MPSVASLLKIPYQNNSMGQNLFDTAALKNCAFIIDHDSKDIGLVNSQYYFIKNLKTAKTTFVSVTDNNPVKPSATTDSIKNAMSRFTDAYYQTSRYLLFNNKRKR
jgi:hypothetical protein